MNKAISIVLVIFALAIAATYYPWQKTEEAAPIVELDNSLKIVEEDERLNIKYPLPEVSSKSIQKENIKNEPSQAEIEIPTIPEPIIPHAPKSLPHLDESDNDIAVAIKQLTDVSGLFLFKSFIRHFVVTIDNMTNQKIPQRYAFSQRVPEKFTVMREDVDTIFLDSKNFNRYSNFVNMAERIDTRELASVYIRFYPLFQEAYEELGYPDRYFNDRLIQVIDHLLKAPEIKGSIKLVKPKVFWLFANSELESLSAGQKILARIGHENAQLVKAKLNELRGVLTTFPPQ